MFTLPSKDKLDQRAFKCIFLGYNTGQKAYKIYDIDRHKLIVSRDVQFYEHSFPYKDSIEQTHQAPDLVSEESSDFSEDDDSSSESDNDNQEESTTGTKDDSNSPMPRRSHRESKRHGWHDDYVVGMVSRDNTILPRSSKYPLSVPTLNDINALSTNHIAFMSNVFLVTNHIVSHKPMSHQSGDKQ